ncbi:MAG: hypothetical protein A2W04_03770 [Betaproteobacteria bacterium RBG_16_64_9]|nr:MAG: hypothetical protein A2W04_03770 [Betaproteobacteria bacterium RBG_16_64_9]
MGVMQTIQSQVLEPRLQQIEADLMARIEVVFRQCPNLVGFALQDSAGLPDDMDKSGILRELFITEIDFVVPVHDDKHDEICNMINVTISDLICERHEAFELLRDRTFARVLH